jgi:hypothetical protein
MTPLIMNTSRLDRTAKLSTVNLTNIRQHPSVGDEEQEDPTIRDHIDFIQTQNLPWQDASQWGLSENGKLKRLSHDPETGELSALVHFDGTAKITLEPGRDLEFLVIEGALSVDDERYDRYHFGFVPAGRNPRITTGASGVIALVFTSPLQDAARLTAEAIEQRSTPKRDLNNGVWDGDFDKFNLGSMKEGARMRVLREDPFTGETTYLTATMAFRRGSQAERHPISQEFFLLSGELAGEFGIMQAGAYCIRPPMAKHGPYGSPTGALIFFRGLGGPQVTHWEDAAPFRFDPEFNPIIPDDLKPYSRPVPRTQVY